MRILLTGLVIAFLQMTTASAAELTGTLKRIAETGQINLGFRAAEPPMSFRDQDGTAAGYSIDICGFVVAKVKQKLGRSDIKVNYVLVTAETRFAAIEADTIDILCGATTKTLSRAERVGFTQLTFVTGGSLLSLNGTEIPNVMGLKGKRVAVVSNTTTIDALKRAIEKTLTDAEILPVESAVEGMSMLDSGYVDAFASDQVVLIGQIIARKSDRKYFLSKELFSFEPFALAVARGDPDFRLVADRALSQIYRTGQVANIYSHWFGRFGEITPALKALYRLNATPE